MPVSADTLCQSGIAYPVAIEIARQMNAGAGNGSANKLVAIGIPPQKATELAAQINAAVFDSHKLSLASWPAEIARSIKKTSGL